MKINMGDSKLKRLSRMGERSIAKVTLSDKPTNRAERRKFSHVLKRTHVTEDEIDQDALFEALRERNGRGCRS